MTAIVMNTRCRCLHFSYQKIRNKLFLTTCSVTSELDKTTQTMSWRGKYYSQADINMCNNVTEAAPVYTTPAYSSSDEDEAVEKNTKQEEKNVTNEQRRKNRQKAQIGSATVCKFFAEHGTCKFGAQCKYKHGEDDGTKVVDVKKHAANHHATNSTKPTDSMVCKYYKSAAGCSRGDQCKFKHE